MEPGASRSSNVRTGVQRVNHASSGSTRRGRDQHGRNALRTVSLYHRLQGPRVHSPRTVGRHQTYGAAAHARVVRNLGPGRMTFGRSVEGHGTWKGAHAVIAEVRIGVRERAHQRGVIGLRAAGRKVTD